jgi:hypothetical protein
VSVQRIPRGVVALGFVSLFMDVSSEMIHSLLPLFLVSVLKTSALTFGVIEGVAEASCDPQKLESEPEQGSRGRQCVLVMESSEDRIGAHDVGFSAAMARGRSGNRDDRGIRNPRTQPHVGRPRL